MASPSAPVPVALFTHRRPDLLRRTLTCLRETGVERLYVFSDGPRDAGEAEAVERVRDLVRSLDWIEPVLLARSENLGLSESIREGLTWLFESHDTAIVVEDDVCVAPEFYDYARRALAHYRGDERVAGVTGLRLPFDTKALDAYPFDVFLAPRFSSWGWATWGDRWRSFSFDLVALRREIAAGRLQHPQRAGADMAGMIQKAVVAETVGGAWDVVCATNMLLHGWYFVTPAWNMVENTGFTDGTHFTVAPRWHLRWEPQRRPREPIRFAPVVEYEPVLAQYRRFFRRRRGQELIGRARKLVGR